jgi:uncharacterized protein (TIGR03437 family)
LLAIKIITALLFAAPSVLSAAGAPSSIALSNSPNASVFGAPVTLTAAVAPIAATGSVTFYDGTAVLGTARLAGGLATLTTIFLPAGARSLKAYYLGDTSYAPATSATLTQHVDAIPGGEFQAAVSYGTGNSPISITLGDFNGDDRQDLAVWHFGGVGVLLGNGDGTFLPALQDAVSGWSIAVGDFNGDGRADLATTINGSNGGVNVLLGKGDGTFQAAVSYSVGSFPESIAVGDFNGDGWPDLVTANHDGTVSVLLANGDGTFHASVSYHVGSQLWSVAVGDFNGDGRADLAVADSGDNNVSVLLGNGDGTFRAVVSYATGAFPDSIAVGDFNGDGKLDIAAANDVSNNISVLLGNGDGTFRTAVNYSVGSYPQSVAVGDFNGDGWPDLAVVNAYSLSSQGGNGNVSVLYGNGDGTFGAAANYDVGIAPDSIAVGDFNGDGRADLVTANRGSNNVSVLLGLAPAPDLSIGLTHAGNFAQGQSGGTYAITANNVGYAPTTGAVTVTDSLPSGLTATSISGAGWTCVLASLTCTRSDSLARFASYPAITLTVSVAADAPSGVINTIAVSGGGETNTANDVASDFATTFTASQIARSWSQLPLPVGLTNFAAALLLTDGTVMVQQICSGSWYRFAPDAFGNYINGTWSRTAPMPPGYAPLYFSSAVLADGRVVVIGGEYNSPCTSPVDTNLGAIYDPLADIWTPLSAPSGSTNIGDAQNTVLPGGQFLLADSYGGPPLTRLDPITLTWTILRGTGKADGYAEEGWTLLPDGTVLTIDTQGGPGSERYFPQTDSWASAGIPVAPLTSFGEIGPQVLRPDGTVFVAGSTGHTGIYNAASGTWAAGPDFPVSNGQKLVVSDGVASLLPSGNVLVGSGGSTYTSGASGFMFEFDGVHLNPVPYFGTCIGQLPLPTGQTLCSNGSVSIYTSAGSPSPVWAPTLTVAPTVVQPGQTYTITGTQFNGLSQAVGFGDDYQGATNYPLARIVNTATGHVFYCRTHNHSTMGVATATIPVSTQFDVPPSIEAGPSTLVVVANGIASTPWNLNVAATAAPYLSGLNPSSAIAGSEAFTLTVNGTGFLSGATVTWNGTELATTVVGAAQLTAAVPGALVAAAGTANIAVTDSAGTSNALTFMIQAGPAPSISPAGIVPLYSTTPSIEPGEWVSIYGNNLASATVIWNGEFPTSLGGTSVTINGNLAYLSYVSPTQINLQAPDEATRGPVPVIVTTANGTSASTVTLGQFGPSFCLLDSKHVAGIILRSNGSGAYGEGAYDIIGPTGNSLGYQTVAAKAGDTIELFALGLGPTNPAVPAGQAFSGSAPTTDLVTLLVNSLSVTPAFVGLSSAGLYQINLTVPAGLGTGDVPLVATVGGVQTPLGVVISLR